MPGHGGFGGGFFGDPTFLIFLILILLVAGTPGYYEA
jgi:hypothetical protein